MLKLLGSIVVISASGVMGFIYSNFYLERVKQIRDMQYALNILETEIIYTSLPLSEALEFTAEKCSKGIKSIFKKISKMLKEKTKQSVYEAFKDACALSKDEIYFGREEMDVLESFMQSLGVSDMEGQKKNFNITIKKLEEIEKKAEVIRTKNERLYRYLGICMGVLIVIILI